MSRRHGRATLPFGKHRGVRVSLCDDAYLSWLSGWLAEDAERMAKFQYVFDSIVPELNHRGLRGDLADDVERVDPPPAVIQDSLTLEPTRSRRAYRLEEIDG